MELQHEAGWVAVAAAKDLRDGKVTSGRIGDRKVALVKLGDTIHALDALCPHKRGPLDAGDLKGEGELVCPWHQFRFDPRTGATTMPCNAFPPLHTFPVRVVGDEVQVRVG